MALRESINDLDKIINSISDPIFVIDRQHRFVLVNDAKCKMLGLSREDILGKTTYDIFYSKEMADTHGRRMRKSLRQVKRMLTKRQSPLLMV